MAQAGYLSNAPTQFHNLPKFAALSDTTQTLETRARSWLAVNCSYCHQAGGTAPGVFDLRPELSLTQANLIGTHVAVELAPTHRALVRGDALASIIRNRSAASGGYTRMPPLATAVIDPEGVQVLTDWINASTARQTYAEWRLAEFGSGSSPAGVPTHDSDGDGISNQDEYLTLTDPEDPASRLAPAVSVSSGNVAVQFPNLQGRLIKVLTSTDLLNWSTWQLPGNNGLPANSGSTRTLIAPLDSERRFFRLDVQEQ
jgi:mono/diheme cytochrome c family protein